MRNMIAKLFLFGLVLLLGKAPVLSQEQDTDIRCEIGGLDFNLSQSDPGYGFEFGNFFLFAEGKKDKEGAVGIARFYKLPRTNLILSVGVGYVPNGETPSDPQLMVMMILGRKKAPISSDAESDKFFDEITKHAVSQLQVGYPMWRLSTKDVRDGSECHF